MSGARIRRGPLFHYLSARTIFFDDQVLQALDAGLAQVVVVGAGYDARALRFRTTGVRFFEVDHPDTQRDKRERLEALDADLRGVSFVPIDFATDDVAAALGAAGHETARGSLMLCEGVVVYLDERVISELLLALRRRAAQDSVLAVQFPLRAPRRWHRLQQRAFDFGMAVAGEQPRTRFARAEAL